MLTLPAGHVLLDELGNAMSVVNHLGRGGQGDTYEVQSTRSGFHRAAKLFFDDGPVTKKRIDWLVAARLPHHCTSLIGPLARLAPQHGLGTVLPLAPGVSLESLFKLAPLSVADALAIGAAICRAIDALEQLGAGHCDISAMNVFVERLNDGAVHAYLIDLDNVAVDKLPRCPMLGSPLYVSPEVGEGSERPSIIGDRWSLAVLLHVLLTGTHPFTTIGSRAANTAAYIEEVKKAGWIDDPLRGPSSNAAIVSLLSPGIQELFRRTFQPNPWTRPCALAWSRILNDALRDLHQCTECGTQCVNHPGRNTCPGCGGRPRPLVLAIVGRRIPLGAMVTEIGRDDVGGEPTISRKHVVIRRFGIGVRIRDVSTNGTAVLAHGQWTRVPPGSEVVLAEGDRVLLAPGVVGDLEEA